MCKMAGANTNRCFNADINHMPKEIKKLKKLMNDETLLFCLLGQTDQSNEIVVKRTVGTHELTKKEMKAIMTCIKETLMPKAVSHAQDAQEA